MYNKTYCQFAATGLFFSHRGPGFCCHPSKKYPGLDVNQWWNSEYRKQSVEKMKQGIKVDECSVCYQEEENNEISTRMVFNKKIDFSTSFKTLPKQMDLDLSNFCNLKCIMCSPSRSSQWAKDKGIFAENNGISNMTREEIDKICELSYDLEFLQIQGGEPSIMPEYDYYFDFLKKNDIIKNIDLYTITNLTNLNTKFFKFLENFKKVTLGVSIDSHGLSNNYIRYPSNFEKIEKNLIKMNESTFDIQIVIALQTLSMFNFDEFLNWLDKMHEIYKKNNKLFKIFVQKVYSPEELCVYNAPLELKKKFIRDIETYFLNSNKLNRNHFFKIELKNTINQLSIDKNNNDIDLKTFINNLDQKRNIKITDYIPTFHDYF